MTLSELRSLCRKRLGDAGGAFWTDAEIDAHINDGCRDVAFRTKSIEGVREWTLSTAFTDIYAVEDVYFNRDGTDWDKLTPTSREALNNDTPGWVGNVGYTSTAGGTTTYNYSSNASVPTHYYWDREEDMLGIDTPQDDGNSGTNYLHVYYTKKHTDISGDGDSPQIPEPLHQSVVNFVTAVGFEDRGWGDRANDQWNKYFQRIKDYGIETIREREDEEIISRNYRS